MTREREKRLSAADLVYDSFSAGAIGGLAVALTFLVVDSVFDHPFFTPSLLGQALFFGAAPASVTHVSIKAMAWFTPVHFIVFFFVGLVGAVLVRTMERSASRPFWVMLVLFCLMEGGYLFVTHFFLHGVADLLGEPRVAGVNLFAAIAMVGFLHRARHTETEAGKEHAEASPSPAT